jgi:hypothetical protein
LKDEGFTFLDVAPGMINTADAPPSEEDLKVFGKIIASFKKVYPEWSGLPYTPAESVKLMLDIIDNSTVLDSGKFVSQKVSDANIIQKTPSDSHTFSTLSRIIENGCDHDRRDI